MNDLVGSSSALVELAAEIQRDWASLGLQGGFAARHLDTGDEVAVAPGRAFPMASVVKLPLALAVLDACAAGELEPDEPTRFEPGSRTPGPSGLSLFTRPCTVALDDLVTSALAVSDNAAADALLDRLPPEVVTERLHTWGYTDLYVRHRIRALYDAIAALTPTDQDRIMVLATTAATRGGGHVIPELDVARANAGTAAGLVRLLADVWDDRVSTPAVTADLRARLGHQLTRHRMAGDLVSDAVTLRSKTGTFLNLRHEAGVVTLETGERIAVVALTSSTIPAREQPEADAAIGWAARAAVEALVRAG